MSSLEKCRFCPQCAAELAWITLPEDGGPKERLRCPRCDYTHWNNPTPVLAAIVEQDGCVLLARNAAWTQRFFGLITGFMEAGESPEAGVQREIMEETNLSVSSIQLVGVYDFPRMNQVIIVYHANATGQVTLSPELSEYRWVPKADVKVWPQGTGQGLAKWLRSEGFEPQMMAFE